MRTPEYLSPSSLKCAEDDQEEFYFRYLAETRIPKIPQTQPMSVGSAFDAYVKSYLHHALFGENHKDSNKFQLQSLFESQVESHNRDWALVAGRYVFWCYKESGALSDLMLELNGAVDDPSFEFEVKGEVKGYREGVTMDVEGMVLLGKPDIRFVNREGLHCIFDWKVNGYCGKANTSPKPGYVRCREWTPAGWAQRGCHKDAFPQVYRGILTNPHKYLETVDRDWATQNCTYGWLLGEAVGAEFLSGIDQVCGNGTKSTPESFPVLRIASHRCRVSESFQFETLARFQNLWKRIRSGHFFQDLSKGESDAKCQELDRRAWLIVHGEGTDQDWALNIARQ